MAVAYQNSVKAAGTRNNGSSGTFTLTVAQTLPAGTNLLLCFVNADFGNSGGVSTPTYNGVGMTLYASIGSWNNIYYMINPPTGAAYNVACSVTSMSGGGGLEFFTASYSGVNTASPLANWTSPGSFPSVYDWTSGSIASVANGHKVIYSPLWFNNAVRQSPPSWTAYSPSVFINQVEFNYDDSQSRNVHSYEAAATQPGTGGSITFHLSSPYSLQGTYYVFDVNPAVTPKAYAQSILFF